MYVGAQESAFTTRTCVRGEHGLNSMIFTRRGAPTQSGLGANPQCIPPRTRMDPFYLIVGLTAATFLLYGAVSR